MLTNLIVIKFHNIYGYQIITPYTLNLYPVIYQFYLNKSGKNINAIAVKARIKNISFSLTFYTIKN